MKLICTLLLFCLLAGFAAQGQCVVYACNTTGAWGAGFNGPGEHYSVSELTKIALQACRTHGGKNCGPFISSTQSGWYAITSGKKADGSILVLGVEGGSSEASAKYRSEKKYIDSRGLISRGSFETMGWHVP